MHREGGALDGVRQSLRQHWSRLEARYQIVFACFLATFTAYVERVGFPLAFTALAKDADIGEAKKGTVMSAFFWGYAVSQVCNTSIPSNRNSNVQTVLDTIQAAVSAAMHCV